VWKTVVLLVWGVSIHCTSSAALQAAPTASPYYWTGVAYDVHRKPDQPHGVSVGRIWVTLENYGFVNDSKRKTAYAYTTARSGDEKTAIAVLRTPMEIDGTLYGCPLGGGVNEGPAVAAAVCGSLPASITGHPIEALVWYQKGPQGSSMVIDQMWSHQATSH
jgi:hypothetical protein